MARGGFIVDGLDLANFHYSSDLQDEYLKLVGSFGLQPTYATLSPASNAIYGDARMKSLSAYTW